MDFLKGVGLVAGVLGLYVYVMIAGIAFVTGHGFWRSLLWPWDFFKEKKYVGEEA